MLPSSRSTAPPSSSPLRSPSSSPAPQPDVAPVPPHGSATSSVGGRGAHHQPPVWLPHQAARRISSHGDQQAALFAGLLRLVRRPCSESTAARATNCTNWPVPSSCDLGPTGAEIHALPTVSMTRWSMVGMACAGRLSISVPSVLVIGLEAD